MYKKLIPIVFMAFLAACACDKHADHSAKPGCPHCEHSKSAEDCECCKKGFCPSKDGKKPHASHEECHKDAKHKGMKHKH